MELDEVPSDTPPLEFPPGMRVLLFALLIFTAIFQAHASEIPDALGFKVSSSDVVAVVVLNEIKDEGFTDENEGSRLMKVRMQFEVEYVLKGTAQKKISVTAKSSSYFHNGRHHSSTVGFRAPRSFQGHRFLIYLRAEEKGGREFSLTWNSYQYIRLLREPDERVRDGSEWITQAEN